MVSNDVSLRQLLRAIDKIQTYTSGMSHDDFLEDHKTIDACLMVLVHMGEVVASMMRKGMHIPFDDARKIKGLRNFLAHQYLMVRPSLIVKTIYDDLPVLKSQILKNIDL